MANGIKIGASGFDALKIGSADVDAAYIGDTLIYSGGTPPTPTLQWVTFSNGDTIPSDLQIYGISGAATNMMDTFGGDWSNPMYFTPSRNRVEIVISCDGQSCYSDNPYNTDTISLIFSNVGCCDYVNQGATVSGTIQLYIYA